MGLIDTLTGLIFGNGLQFQTPIGGAGLTITASSDVNPPPVLTWDDPNQQLIVDFAQDLVVVGNVVHVQYYADASLTIFVDEASDTLDASNILDGFIDVVPA